MLDTQVRTQRDPKSGRGGWRQHPIGVTIQEFTEGLTVWLHLKNKETWGRGKKEKGRKMEKKKTNFYIGKQEGRHWGWCIGHGHLAQCRHPVDPRPVPDGRCPPTGGSRDPSSPAVNPRIPSRLDYICHSAFQTSQCWRTDAYCSVVRKMQGLSSRSFPGNSIEAFNIT